MAERRGLVELLFGRRIQQRVDAGIQQYRSEHPTRPTLDRAVLMQAQSIGYFGSRSSGAKWAGGQSNAYGGRIWDHWRTRQQARDIVEDSVHAYTLVHRKADTVVDTGLRLEPTPRARMLGISEEQADAWAQGVAEAFDAWCREKAQHRAATLSFYEAQHLLQVADMRDNDEFLRLFYSQRSDLLSQLQFEVIDPNQVRGDALTSTTLVLRGADGIVRGADGTERAYKVWVAPDPERPGQYEEITVPRTGEKSGRLMMLHAFRPEYAGQGRGYSRLGVTMQNYEDLESYILSIVRKAINQSQMVGVVENEKNPSSNPFENLGMPPAGPGPAITATVSGSAAPAVEAGAPSFVPVEEAAFGSPGATLVTRMAEGDTLKLLQNTVPGPDFERAVDTILEPLVSPYMGLELFKIKFEASYSAARAALQVAWRIITMDRALLDANIIALVYGAWLACEIAAGRVSCPGWQDPRLRSAWSAHVLVGSPPIQVDPEKEVQAAKGRLEIGAANLKQVTHELGGGDLAANIAANIRDFAKLPAAPWAKAAAAAPASEEKEGEPPAPGRNGQQKSRRMPAGVR